MWSNCARGEVNGPLWTQKPKDFDFAIDRYSPRREWIMVKVFLSHSTQTYDIYESHAWSTSTLYI